MAKPQSNTGYQLRWHELAGPAFQLEGEEFGSMRINDIDARIRAELRTLRTFIIRCYIEDIEETDPIGLVGLNEGEILRVIASELCGIKPGELAELKYDVVEALVIRKLNHWKLPDNGYRVALGSIASIQNRVELLEPFRPDDVQPPQAWRD